MKLKTKHRFITAVCTVVLLSTIGSTAFAEQRSGSECDILIKASSIFFPNNYPRAIELERGAGTAKVESGTGTAIIVCPVSEANNNSIIYLNFKNGSDTVPFSCDFYTYTLDRKNLAFASVKVSSSSTNLQKDTIFSVQVGPSNSPAFRGKPSSTIIAQRYLKCVLPEPTPGSVTELVSYGNITNANMPRCVPNAIGGSKSHDCRQF